MPVDPATAKIALQITQSLVRSRTARRLLVAVVVLQLIALTVVLFLPAYLASVTATSAQRVFSTDARQLRCRDCPCSARTSPLRRRSPTWPRPR